LKNKFMIRMPKNPAAIVIAARISARLSLPSAQRLPSKMAAAAGTAKNKIDISIASIFSMISYSSSHILTLNVLIM